MSAVVGTIVGLNVRGTIVSSGAYNWDYYWLSRFVSTLALVQTDDDVTLTWVNNGTVDWDYILIERKLSGGDYAQIAQITKTLETYTDENFTVEGTYYYRIRLIKGTHYSSYCTAISIAVSLVPDGAPVNLTVVVDSNTAATLNFDIGSTNHDGHRIYISTDGVTFTENSTVLGAVATKQVTGLTAATQYWFYVKAYKGTYESTASNTVSKYTFDTNAFAFIAAASLSDATEKEAVSEFVTDLKAINATQADFINFDTPASSVLRASYPLLGSATAKQKFNLIDPRDLDAAFRLTFADDAAGDHTSAGYILNNSSKYADTHLVPATHLTEDNTHLAIYMCDTGEVGTRGLIGCQQTGKGVYMYSYIYATNRTNTVMYSDAINAVYDFIPSAEGLQVGSRTAVNYLSSFKNGKKLTSNAGSDTGALPTNSIFIGSRNGATIAYGNGTVGYSSVGAGITDAANILYWEAVRKFMVKIGRRIEATAVTAGVAISFDDYTDVSLNAEIPGLQSIGMKYTACAEGVSFGGASLAELKKHILNGASVCSHSIDTATAPDYLAGGKTAQEYYDDKVAPNIAALNAEFGINVKTFGYPSSQHVESVTNVLLAEGITLVRSSLSPFSRYDGTNQFILSVPFDNTDFTLNQYKAMVDDALANGNILLLHGHQIADTANAMNISWATLKAVVEYVLSKNMTFYHYDELLPSLFA